ncbi:uncharacterized protein METZ01_LOCUS483968, partial [marine metagenome]
SWIRGTVNISPHTALVFGSGQVAQELSRANIPGWKIVLTPHSSVDICCLKAVRTAMATRNYSVVINAAAFTDVKESEKQPKKCLSVNRDGAANIAIIASERSVPMLHLSTDYVFDGRKKDYYFEQDVATPKNVYGASKLAGEQKIREYCSKHIIVRTSWVFSSHGNNFLNTMASLFNKRRDVDVVGDQIGCPTPASSIAKMLLQLSQQIVDGKDSWGVYHYCGRPEISWYDFAKRIFYGA